MAERMGSDEEAKTVLVKHIQFLSQKLESLQLRCDELRTKNQALASRNDALKTDTKDICEYLEYTAAEKDENIRKMAEQMEREKLADQQEDEALELKHNQELQKLLDGIHQQEEYNRKLAAKVEKQEAGREQLEEQLKVLMKQRSDTESEQKELIRQGKEDEATISELKAQSADMWLKHQKEMQLLEEGVIEFTDQEKAYIKTRVQEERAQHAATHEKFLLVLNENEVMWRERDELGAERSVLLHEVDHAKKRLEENKKINATRSEKLDRLAQRKQRLQRKLEKRKAAHEKLLEEEEAERQLLASVSEELRQKKSEASQLRAELQTERSGRKRQEAGMKKAVFYLNDILKDFSVEKLKAGQNKKLLEMMQENYRLGPGTSTVDSSPLATDPLFLMARYRPGDLGLVPRPTYFPKPAACRTGPHPPPFRSVRKKTCRQKRAEPPQRKPGNPPI